MTDPNLAPARPAAPNWLRPLLLMAVFLVVGGGLGWVAGRYLRSLPAGGLPGPVTLIGFGVAAWFAALALHELGHVLGMLGAGFRVVLYVVGPIKIVREGERLRLRLNRDWALAGGVAAGVPQRPSADDRALMRRYAVIVAAGPAMSLAVAVLSGLALTLTAGTPAVALSALAFLNGAIFLVTAIPAKTSGFDTDGAQFLDIWRGGHRAERKRLATLMAAYSAGGQRPREWAPALMERWLALRDGTAADAIPNLYGYYYALDRGAVAEAGEFMDRVLAQRAGMPGPFRPAVLLEAAYFAARHRGQAAAARALLDQARGGTVEAQARRRAEAAVLLGEGRPAEAAAKARAGLAEAAKAWDRGGATAEADWLAALLADAERASAGGLDC